MISTKNLISNIVNIPREWVFEHYLSLTEKLTGQDVNMKSPFSADRVPSLYIYYSTSRQRYQFKDFSTGKAGDGVTLVKELLQLELRREVLKSEAAAKVVADYNQYQLDNKEEATLREFKVQQRYKVVKFTKREWTTLDQKYWIKYHIGSKLLRKYNVAPLSDYTMVKEVDGVIHEMVIKGNYIYGYFKKDGTLYKIYQPMVRDNKFIKVCDHIQGLDQLTMSVPYLVICSSLKDVMGFVALGYANAEAIAPDSENCMMPAHIMTMLLLKYKKVVILFDNDQGGLISAKKYLEKYAIPYVILEMSKDLTDSIKDHNINRVREVLTPAIKLVLGNE